MQSTYHINLDTQIYAKSSNDIYLGKSVYVAMGYILIVKSVCEKQLLDFATLDIQTVQYQPKLVVCAFMYLVLGK